MRFKDFLENTKGSVPGDDKLGGIDPEESAVAEDRCGMSVSRGMLPGVDLELPDGNVEGVYYAAILGRVRFNPSTGITFRFEDAEGLWEVVITGNNLRPVHRDLKNMRRDTVRIGEAGSGVTGISVRPWSPPGKKG